MEAGNKQLWEEERKKEGTETKKQKKQSGNLIVVNG
jgi:hypothetical protein